MVMRWFQALAVVVLLLAAAALATVRRVGDGEMRPTLKPGDLVVVLPVKPLRGDIVVLRDPLDPDRRVLRRALTDGDSKVRWDEGGLRINGKRVRQTDMGELEGDSVQQEVIWSKPPARAKKWLVRLRKPPAFWTSDVVEVPEEHWYLLADDRDRAVDSRWWGPVPESAIEGVVRLRVGPPDTWRGLVEVQKGWE
ncbi:MAG: signal peptidase I [Deltaproteobacteria bacterium]|nr:MAG: signal peptidase I [Deltaproteobacteria bacterium]